MSPTPDYDEVVSLYIRVIRGDSPGAADAIEQIRITCGARAALRATLAMTLVKIEDQRHHPIPDFSRFGYMLVDYPQALPLLEQAIQYWVKDRHLREVSLGLRPKGAVTDSETAGAEPTPPTLED